MFAIITCCTGLQLELPVHLPANADPALTPPLGMEIAFVTDNLQKVFDAAIKAGAKKVKGTEQKPLGQTVAYVRDPDGFLVEICTPMI